MKFKNSIMLTALLAVGSMTASGCTRTVVVTQNPGPVVVAGNTAPRVARRSEPIYQPKSQDPIDEQKRAVPIAMAKKPKPGKAKHPVPVVKAKKPKPIVVVKTPGPPPHAPAHGYRHKHSNGPVLVFDSRLGIYTVSGQKNLYYHKNHYYRWHKSAWQTGDKFDGKFKTIKVAKLPKGFHKSWQKKQKASAAKVKAEKKTKKK